MTPPNQPENGGVRTYLPEMTVQERRFREASERMNRLRREAWMGRPDFAERLIRRVDEISRGMR